MRSQAKAINFGIIYGMGPQRLAEETGVSLSEAKTFIEKYFQAYPKIRRYTQNLILQAREFGFTQSMSGRRRPIPGIHDGNKAVLARAENIAINAPIQGSAADLIKQAMLLIDADVKKRACGLRMILQIHDELLFSSPLKELEQNMALVEQHMSKAWALSVPLDVEIRSGKDWLEAH